MFSTVPAHICLELIRGFPRLSHGFICPSCVGGDGDGGGDTSTFLSHIRFLYLPFTYLVKFYASSALEDVAKEYVKH